MREAPQDLLTFLQSEEKELAGMMLAKTRSFNSLKKTGPHHDVHEQEEELIEMETDKVFEPIDMSRKFNTPPDENMIQSPHGAEPPIKEEYVDADLAIFELIDKSEKKTILLGSNLQAEKTPVEDEIIEIEHVNTISFPERTLNDILLSKDGWMAELANSCQNRNSATKKHLKRENGQRSAIWGEIKDEEISQGLEIKGVVDIFKEGEANIQNDDLFEKPPKREHDQVSHNRDVINELEIANYFEKCLTQKDEFSSRSFCDLCRKRIRTPLQKHMRIKHGIKKKMPTSVKVCHFCNKEFNSSGHLQRHIVIHYDDREKFPCGQCHKTMSSEQSLKSHINNVHLGLEIRNFPCPNCPLRCASKKSLDLHFSRIHDEAGSFKCDMCERVFNTEDYMMAHKRKLHSGERVRKYACNSCEKRFYERQKLSYHEEAVHIKSGKFRCSICLKNLGGRNHLNRHMKSHLNIKDFVCFHCGRAFVQKIAMERHIDVVHNKMKLLSCHVCGKNFGQSGDRNRHIRIHHSELA